ncbi:MAG: metalloregulator ArsR/SmtB family transcription factor [Fervidobacterium sp.]|nr:metalloregulator ArsR/SmtB family transcription factor [Fervidobacterium sp.]
MENVYQQHAKVFKAFCDDNRLKILEILRDGEKCACKLLEHLNINQSSLSYHMKILVESGIVESREEGKWTYYKISEKGSKYAIELLRTLTNVVNSRQEVEGADIQNPGCCKVQTQDVK